MRRRLLQAATVVVLIAATLGSHPPAAAALPDPPTDWPPTVCCAPYIGPDELIAATAPQTVATPPGPSVTESPRPEPAAADTPPPAPTAPSWPDDAGLYRLRMCESTDRYGINTGNGYYGAYQWLRSTWNAIAQRSGRPDLIGVRPDLAAPADQDAMTRYLWTHSDPHTQWPVCSYRV